MDPDDGLDEDEPLFPWLPPDDRLWRHPSELASSRGPGGPVGPAGSSGPGSGDENGASSASRGTSETSGNEGSVAGRRGWWEGSREGRAGHPVGAPVRVGATARGPRTSTATVLSPRDLDRRLWAVALLAGVVGALLASGAGVVVGQYHHTTVVRPVEQVVQPNPYVTIAAPKSEDIVDIAARVRPTIVELLVSTNGANGSGSGVIFADDGYILTNDHVVDGAQSVVAVTSDGRHISGHLVGADRATDIAVVKLDDAKPHLVATLGTSTQLKVGQLAIAIGSPLGSVGVSVTSGIISAVDRQVDPGTGPSLLDMIQTDAPLEPGSSGGALVDGSGTVIGINTVVAFTNQTAAGPGFATPIEVARDVANQILSSGKVAHAWLGVEGADVDIATAKSLGITDGAVVQAVDSQSPAANAGVAATDVVTAFAGQPVDSMSTLEMSVREHRPGDRIPITFIHDGDTRTTTVVLLERPDSDYP